MRWQVELSVSKEGSNKRGAAAGEVHSPVSV
jgi:hypothetical protein